MENVATVTRIIGVAVVQNSCWWCISLFRTQNELNVSDINRDRTVTAPDINSDRTVTAPDINSDRTVTAPDINSDRTVTAPDINLTGQ
jgi:hypothetical protein